MRLVVLACGVLTMLSFLIEVSLIVITSLDLGGDYLFLHCSVCKLYVTVQKKNVIT